MVLQLFINISAFFVLYKALTSSMKKLLAIVGAIAVGYFENDINTDEHGEAGDLMRELAAMQSSIADNSRRYEQQVAETEVAYFNLERRPQP